MSEPRVIKKYPNRRLYDTTLSKYITLEDVRRLVHDRVDFVVRDAQTDEDLTRTILLQIISEQEAGGDPIFTIPVLTQIIRFYGDAVQGLASDFLQRSLTAFGDQQQQFRRQLDQIMNQDAMGGMTELTQRNLALWRELQGAMFSDGPAQPEPAPASRSEPSPGSRSESSRAPRSDRASARPKGKRPRKRKKAR
jgi:polyhydroxyalkanoate synthesis repressor PhaR